MSYRPFARLAGLSLAGVLLLGCDVTDTPNRTGQDWLEETGVTLPEPFTIRVPIEIDSLGAENSESRVIAPGSQYGQYAGTFADLHAEWRVVYRPGYDPDWKIPSNAKGIDSVLIPMRDTIGDWELGLEIDSFARDASKELKLRLRLDTLPLEGDSGSLLELLAPRQIDELVRVRPLSGQGLDTVVTVTPDQKGVWIIKLPPAWTGILRGMRTRGEAGQPKRDSSRVAVFSLASASPADSGMARIIKYPYLRIQQAIQKDTGTVKKIDSLLPALTTSKARAFATRITMPAFAKGEPVIYAGPRWRNVRVKIDSAKFRAAVRAALPPAYRNDPKWADPFVHDIAKFNRYSVLGARLQVHFESVLSEGGRKHPFVLSSRGDSVPARGMIDTVIGVGSTIEWEAIETKEKQWTMSVKEADQTLLLIVAPADNALEDYLERIDTLAIEPEDVSPIYRKIDGKELLVQRVGAGLRVRLKHESLATRIESQSDSSQYREASLVAPGRTTIDLQARTTFARLFDNPARSIVVGLTIGGAAFDPADNNSDPSRDIRRDLNGLNGATFVKARLADKPLGEAVILLQPLGSKGRN